MDCWLLEENWENHQLCSRAVGPSGWAQFMLSKKFSGCGSRVRC